MNRRPIQNVGRENVVRDAITEVLSNTPPLLYALTIPSAMPMTIESIVDTPRSTIVFGRNLYISDRTGCWVLIESPNFRVNIFVTYFTYRTSKGWSMP